MKDTSEPAITREMISRINQMERAFDKDMSVATSDNPLTMELINGDRLVKIQFRGRKYFWYFVKCAIRAALVGHTKICYRNTKRS